MILFPPAFRELDPGVVLGGALMTSGQDWGDFRNPGRRGGKFAPFVLARLNDTRGQKICECFSFNVRL
jgi:hypothetical protein